MNVKEGLFGEGKWEGEKREWGDKLYACINMS
jgi:hypothetical protein